MRSACHTLTEEDPAGFDPAEYSLMKHGELSATQRLGRLLAGQILRDSPWLASDSREIVLPVAYLAVPPSCYFLAQVVAGELAAARPAGCVPPRVVRVHKDAVTSIDYARSSGSERERDLASIGFTLTEPVRDKVVVLIDDVRVTGGAERRMLQVLGDCGALVLGYVAICAPELAAEPQVEARLNDAAVSSILDLLPAIERGDFRLTIRFLKRALRSPELGEFLSRVPDPVVRDLLEAAEATGARFVAEHRHGVAMLRTAAQPIEAAG